MPHNMELSHTTLRFFKNSRLMCPIMSKQDIFEVYKGRESEGA